MSKYPINKNRVCHICSDIENRDATEYELQNMIAVRWTKVYKNKRWTGKYICSRCYSRNNERKRREMSKNVHNIIKNEKL